MGILAFSFKALKRSLAHPEHSKLKEASALVAWAFPHLLPGKRYSRASRVWLQLRRFCIMQFLPGGLKVLHATSVDVQAYYPALLPL